VQLAMIRSTSRALGGSTSPSRGNRTRGILGRVRIRRRVVEHLAQHLQVSPSRLTAREPGEPLGDVDRGDLGRVAVAPRKRLRRHADRRDRPRRGIDARQGVCVGPRFEAASARRVELPQQDRRVSASRDLAGDDVSVGAARGPVARRVAATATDRGR
jgi:hypothetical protein